jgi:hypothetical protein
LAGKLAGLLRFTDQKTESWEHTLIWKAYVSKLESEAELLGLVSTARITLLLQLATVIYLIKFDILCHHFVKI